MVVPARSSSASPCSTPSSRSCRARRPSSSVASRRARGLRTWCWSSSPGQPARSAATTWPTSSAGASRRGSTGGRRRREKTRKRLEWATDQIRKRGGLLLITARFVPGGRTALTITCGITHQPHAWFAAWIAIAAVIWATYAAVLGYVFGSTFQDNHTLAFILAFGAALSITIVIEVVRHQRVKHRRRPRNRIASFRMSSRFGTAGAPAPSTGRIDGSPTSRLHYRDPMLAVVPVRDGELPAGGAETVAECGGRALVAGSSPQADGLAGDRDRSHARRARDVRAGAVGRRARRPCSRTNRSSCCRRSPDGRDLAPRLAHVLGRPPAGRRDPRRARPRPPGERRRHGAARRLDHRPGRRHSAAGRTAACRPAGASECSVRGIPRPDTRMDGNTRMDPTVVAVLPPDVTTMDLAEADRICRRGAGLDGASRFAQLARRGGRARGVDGRDTRRSPTGAGSSTSARSARRASSSTPGCTSRSGSAEPCSTPPDWVRRTTSSASTPIRTAR